MAENFEVEGVEIPDELLEALAGGDISEVPKGQIITLIRVFKTMGYGIDVVEKTIRKEAVTGGGFGYSFDADAAVEYLKSIWDET